MEWSEVHDPNNEFVFDLDWKVVGDFAPEEIQHKIDLNGVLSMVHEVNDYFSGLHGYKPLLLVNKGGRKAVVAR